MSEPANSSGAAARRPADAEDVGSPAALRARLDALVAEADRGDQRALAGLRRMLDEHPEVWRTLGDLAAHAERIWIAAIAGEGCLAAESIRRQVAGMKSDLNGPHPTPTEQLLVDQVIASWLALQHAEIGASQVGGSIAQATLALRRVEIAQKRHLAAVRWLATLRAKLPRGLAPLNAIRLHEPGRMRA